jgi:hypothetical protein
VAAAEYLEVAQKMLFSKDRNPNVILPPPPAPPPEPPMPPLPAYHGQMAIGDPVVFLSVGANGAQKSYKTGEKVGDFEVVSFDRDKITLAWNGKTVERKLQELAPKETAPLAQQPQPAPAPQSAAAPSGVVALGGSQNADSSASKKNPLLGNDSGGGIRSCVANDKTPAGTVVDGYKKVISQGMFGDICRWELVK